MYSHQRKILLATYHYSEVFLLFYHNSKTFLCSIVCFRDLGIQKPSFSLTQEARSAHIGDAGSPSRDYITINATPTSHDTSHDTASNGVHETATAVTTITQNQSNKSEVEEHSGANRNSDSVGLNDVNPSESHQTPSSGGGETVNENSRQMLDGEVGEKDLHDNFR